MKMELLVLTILTALTFTSSSVVDLEPSKMVDIVDDLSGDASKFGAFHMGWGGSPPSSGWSSHSSGWSSPSCATRTKTHTQYLRSTSTVTTGTVSTTTSTLVVSGTPATSTSTICAAKTVCTGRKKTAFYEIKPSAVDETFLNHAPVTENEFNPNVFKMATAMYNTLKDYIEANQD